MEIKPLSSNSNKTYIIGRQGHIRINDPAVSKQHAELQIINGEIFIRDLGSTNGTFLVKNQRLVPIQAVYVQIDQLLLFGNKQYTIRALLEMAGDFTT
ncbi:MAG: pSer/pThr/pTyr-binding forkhead associated (FHA) protein [Gammaproteobacteria bacterium]|jgi:pSer/pThr/pTyr-binding forkhead associated (FHA) protein